jgi:molybdopterin/thiamine biosynthesis adenylyltransferase
MPVGKYNISGIIESAEVYIDPDDNKCLAVSLKALTAIAQKQHISIRDAEIAALKNGIVPWRYLRNTGTIGLEGQVKLLESAVAVVGAGGLGGTIIELLARQGIGHIIIIDNDRFTEQNLNRQLMCTEKNLGKHKALVAARRVRQINSAVTVKTYLERLNDKNSVTLLDGAAVVADALDNLPSRFAAEKACRILKIPMVHGTIAGFCGQLTTIYPEDAGLCCVYGPPGGFMEQGIEVKIGNPSATPAVVAAWQVQEIVKIITGVGKPLRNSLLVLDMMGDTADRIEFTK